MSNDTPKSREAEAKLPPELRPVYQQMVEDYRFLTFAHYGSAYVAYEILAKMVLAGWRHSGEAHPSSELAPKQGGDGR